MPPAISIGSALRVLRYYQAGIVNTVFGVALYSLLVHFGLGMYVAQLVAHCTGVVFNYFTYSRHAFPDAVAPSKWRFAASYLVNYLFGLATLYTAAQYIQSPYLAFCVAAAIVTVGNYFVLRRFVFSEPSLPA